MRFLPEEKVLEIRKDILAGLKTGEIREKHQCSYDTVTKQRKILMEQGLIKVTHDRSVKRYCDITPYQAIRFDELCKPIRKYYERLRNGQGTEKSTGEIKQIRLVPRED